MEIWKPQKKLCSTTVVLFFLLFSICVSAQPVKALDLKAGLWEGINSNLWQYNLLELSADGHHRFFRLSITTAFKKGKLLTFSDEQIVCTSSECTINIIESNDTTIRLIITPYSEASFKVLEINAERDGHPILTQSYQLDQKKEPSTVRNYILNYRNRLKSTTNIQSDGVYGYWLGVLNLGDKPELISLEIYADKKSHFTYFSNGQNTVSKTSFLPDTVIVEQGVIYIETEHPTFANKLIINQLSTNQLSGYMYSTHRGQTLQTGKFSLIRVSLE